MRNGIFRIFPVNLRDSVTHSKDPYDGLHDDEMFDEDEYIVQ